MSNDLQEDLVSSELLSRRDICSDEEDPLSFYIKENIWSSVSWQLEVARRILNYSEYSLIAFDILYFAMLVFEIVINYEHFSSLRDNSGIAFTVFFVLFLPMNALAPPLGMHLIQSILLHPDLPKIFREATKHDSKFHLRMHCMAHFNCFASILAVLLSVFTNPLYKRAQIPFIVLYVIPISFTLSIVVCLLEGHRLLASKLICQINEGDFYSGHTAHGEFTDSSNEKLDKKELSVGRIDFYRLRNDYYALHVKYDAVRERWGCYLLYMVIALLLFTVALIWYCYASDFDNVKFSLALPYIIISLLWLCEIMFSVTYANEVGAQVSRTIAKFILKCGQTCPPIESRDTIMADVNNLLLLSQIVLIQIPFVEGLTLRFRVTAALIGPLIGSLVPKLLS